MSNYRRNVGNLIKDVDVSPIFWLKHPVIFPFSISTDQSQLYELGITRILGDRE
jgi:hypothetical protein